MSENEIKQETQREGPLEEDGNKESSTQQIRLMKTNAGNGYKIVVNGKWYYTSCGSLIDVIENKRRSCTFSKISGGNNSPGTKDSNMGMKEGLYIDDIVMNTRCIGYI